jgi:hypothetical protein
MRNSRCFSIDPRRRVRGVPQPQTRSTSFLIFQVVGLEPLGRFPIGKFGTCLLGVMPRARMVPSMDRLSHLRETRSPACPRSTFPVQFLLSMRPTAFRGRDRVQLFGTACLSRT